MEESPLVIFKSGELILNFVGTIADKLSSDDTGEDEQDQTANESR